jgi:hypothetical protein
VDRRAVVREYYVVQVKSDAEPWKFEYEESVRWLVQYPSPLFLAWVDKKTGIIRVYHVMPRFLLWALGKLPSRFALIPEDLEQGGFSEWKDGDTFSLSAPIIRVSLSDLTNADTMKNLGLVFQYWVSVDRENCDLIRYGLLRFRMPPKYRVNELPDGSIAEMGSTVPEREFLRRGIVTLAESAECVGAQLGRRGDRAAALRAALLVDHLRKTYGEIFDGVLRWARSRLPGDLGTFVPRDLNEALNDGQDGGYLYRGLEAIQAVLDADPVVKRFLAK